VILTEVMAQIELVSLGIYLLNNTINKPIAIALTSSAIDFFKPFPNEKVTVNSEKYILDSIN
jgi:3-hydroxyacyl-[acyl-carrier-protein] dehydratase